MNLAYLYDFGLDVADVNTLIEGVDDNTYSELTLFEGLIKENLQFMKDFGVNNYIQVIVKYPSIFLRDTESFKNIFSKFDREDLLQKVEKNPAVFKKMVDFVDNN